MLIANAVIKMGRKSIVNRAGIVISVLAFLLIVCTGVSPIYVILASGFIGYLLNPCGIGGTSL